MKDRLTEKEKQELRKLLEEQDKPTDTKWLMAEEYSKKTEKENPYNLGCILCTKTHNAAECPNRKQKPKNTYAYSYYNHDNEGY